MGRTVRCVVLVVAALALVPSPGFGWGRDGHQVVANLAQSRLSPQARKGVAALLHGATLASVSTYADNYRNNHPETARWHYVNIPLGGKYDATRDCAPSPEGDCILAAIERFSAILADPSRPEDERADALRFLVHFVADRHQPLHATTKNDRGGNNTKVTFFSQPTNLHAVWDSGMMEHTGLTVTAWTDLLNRSGMSKEGWGTPVRWAEESVRVAAGALLPDPRQPRDRASLPRRQPPYPAAATLSRRRPSGQPTQRYFRAGGALTENQAADHGQIERATAMVAPGARKNGCCARREILWNSTSDMALGDSRSSRHEANVMLTSAATNAMRTTTRGPSQSPMNQRKLDVS